MLRIIITFSLLGLLAFSDDTKDIEEIRNEAQIASRPIMDTMRAELIAQLAKTQASDQEALKEMVPYLIYNILKLEINNLEQVKYECEEMEELRRQALEKLLESRKKYMDYADITKLIEEMRDR